MVICRCAAVAGRAVPRLECSRDAPRRRVVPRQENEMLGATGTTGAQRRDQVVREPVRKPAVVGGVAQHLERQDRDGGSLLAREARKRPWPHPRSRPAAPARRSRVERRALASAPLRRQMGSRGDRAAGPRTYRRRADCN